MKSTWSPGLRKLPSCWNTSAVMLFKIWKSVCVEESGDDKQIKAVSEHLKRRTRGTQTDRFEGHTGEEAVDHHMIVVGQHGRAKPLQQKLLGAQTVDQDVKPHAEI